MAEFAVEVFKIKEVLDHPDADRLVLYKFEENDLTVVAGKDNQQPVGTEMIFFPEHSILPEWILKEFGFWNEEKNVGLLRGKLGNVVKPTKIRGVVSDGIALPRKQVTENHPNSKETDWVKTAVVAKAGIIDSNVPTWADLLGIEKYEAPLPKNNDVQNLHSKVVWDVEQSQKNSKFFVEGEEVVATEKIHGSCCIFKLARDPETGEPKFSVTSKGQGAKGLWFKEDANNWYTRANEKFSIEYNMNKMLNDYPFAEEIVVIGEVFGGTVQKGWHYGVASGDVGFKAFHLSFGDKTNKTGRYDQALALLNAYSIPTVPVLYTGAFEPETFKTIANTEWTDDLKMEGIVVRPVIDRIHPSAKDKVLCIKYISDKYLEAQGKKPIEQDIS